MDFVFWIIAIVLIVGVVWWLLNRKNASTTRGSAPDRHDGALSGGSAAASAEAAGTAGLPSTAGFGHAVQPTPPTTAEEAPERSGTAGHGVGAAGDVDGRAGVAGTPVASHQAAGLPEPGRGQDAVREQDARTTASEQEAARKSDAAERKPNTAGEPLAARQPAVPAESVTPRETGTPHPDAASGDAGSAGTATARQAEDEWETQWSEAGGSAQTPSPAPTSAPGSARPAAPAAGVVPTPASDTAARHSAGERPAQDTGYVHHPEYTDPHSPTLPGAETAAAETVLPDAATAAPPAEDNTAPDATAPSTPAHYAQAQAPLGSPEPMGHLAAEQPYGIGSASPGPDGRGPADFDVKGDAGAMVYYEEGHPDYEQVAADVWFESPAYAEAAGFRAPRRTRR
ncbi:MAG: hypothetical protein JWR71_1350 [Pseudarthrobacter sp.]|nr:hypothetical protein [Pseudarthrobacter sp.]